MSSLTREKRCLAGGVSVPAAVAPGRAERVDAPVVGVHHHAGGVLAAEVLQRDAGAGHLSVAQAADALLAS